MGWAGREGRADNVGETFLVNENGHVSLPFLFFPLSLLGIHFLLPVARLPLFCSVANCSRHASSLSIFLLRPLYDRAIVPAFLVLPASHSLDLHPVCL